MAKIRDLHVTLPEDLARSVEVLAKRRGIKRAQFVREAVEKYVADEQRQQRDREMRAYVEEMAPHSAEFVREAATQVRRLLLEETEW